jgi:hypothetical protein
VLPLPSRAHSRPLYSSHYAAQWPHIKLKTTPIAAISPDRKPLAHSEQNGYIGGVNGNLNLLLSSALLLCRAAVGL